MKSGMAMRFDKSVGLLPAACFYVAVLVSSLPAVGAPQVVSGKVARVTLYRGQALVVREVPLKGVPGSQEVIVSDLPEHVVSESLFAEGNDKVEIRAVRYRQRFIGKAPREEVRTLDVKIEATNKDLALNAKTRELLQKQAAYLDKMEGFIAPTAKTELSKGVLDPEALKQITLFNFEQRQTILTQQVDNEQDARQLQEALALLQRKRSELTNEASQTVREAVIFVEKKGPALESIRLAYLVSSCGWSPSYTIRAGGDDKKVRVECNALIQQMTGEDWSGVDLTLSTASPALSAAAPGLAPFPVVLVGSQQRKATGGELAKQVESIRMRQYSAIVEFQNTTEYYDNLGSNWRANAAANDFQCLELTNPGSALEGIEYRASEEGPSLAYHIPTSVSLASRSDQQMVRIVQTELPSRFHHTATPLLTSYVYREAELTNNSQQDLLGGPMTVYLNGSFVGRGEIPTVARGQTFVVGLGADPQLRAKRELADKDETVQGGNRQLSFSYRLVVENYKDQPVRVSVFDRMPSMPRTADVERKLGELSDPLSEDELYQRIERPKGILRWDISVPASATGENARLIEYSYSVEFDRNFHLAAATSDVPEQQREFEKLQRVRAKR